MDITELADGRRMLPARQLAQHFYLFSVFERVFKDYGLPRAIRTDNGVP